MMASEIAATNARQDALTGTLDETVQCAGCQDEVRVIPGRPGHLEECEECERHCVCFRYPSGIGGYMDERLF